MQKEIGSNFWLAPDDAKRGCETMPNPDIFKCKGTDYVWMSTCRSAIALVIQTVEDRNPQINKVVCLPAFTCHTVFEPFIHKGYKVVTLSVGKDLMSNCVDLLNTIRQAEAGIVLLHRFFGFDTLPDVDSIVNELHDEGIVVIEDCTQSMYSDIDRMDADYFVGSIRKWCGVPDGGFAVCKEGKFSIKPSEPDYDLQEAKRRASEMKYEYLFCQKGKKEDFLTLYRKAEDILDTQSNYYTISPLAVKVQTSLNVESMKEKRYMNYKSLLESLKGIKGVTPIFNDIDKNIVPLYLPILVDKRKEIQSLLVKNAIYAPIVWPKDDACPIVCKDADFLYEHILCIPIDQRYDNDDMERIGKVIQDYNLTDKR